MSITKIDQRGPRFKFEGGEKSLKEIYVIFQFKIRQSEIDRRMFLVTSTDFIEMFSCNVSLAAMFIFCLSKVN